MATFRRSSRAIIEAKTVGRDTPAMAVLMRVLTLLALGGVVMFVWFSVLAEISPRDVRTLSAVVAGVSVLLVVHYLRIDHERRSRAGDPQLREMFNRQRERRGF